MTRALVHHRQRPGTHHHATRLGFTAKIEVIQVKVEALVEAQSAFDQHRTAGAQQHAIEQLDLLIGRAVHVQMLRGKARALPDDAAQVFAHVPLLQGVDQVPCGLARQPALVARQAREASMMRSIQ